MLALDDAKTGGGRARWTVRRCPIASGLRGRRGSDAFRAHLSDFRDSLIIFIFDLSWCGRMME